mmetsp:Transcript_381/g.1084  ORF Transcript_381/g.1084 Transcript_381/m.1084 type:complete len:211 (-) Transcript_381:210-842(-)
MSVPRPQCRHTTPGGAFACLAVTVRVFACALDKQVQPTPARLCLHHVQRKLGDVLRVVVDVERGQAAQQTQLLRLVQVWLGGRQNILAPALQSRKDAVHGRAYAAPHQLANHKSSDKQEPECTKVGNRAEHARGNRLVPVVLHIRLERTGVARGHRGAPGERGGERRRRLEDVSVGEDPDGDGQVRNDCQRKDVRGKLGHARVVLRGGAA